jgi:tetratricopeptide (TPR) repeat protein
MAKTRIRRKDLKRPDEFVTRSARAIVWLREHGRLVAVGGGAAIVLLAVIGVSLALRSAKIRDANEDLGRAMASLRGEGTSEAAAELAAFSERWGSTGVANLARLLEANTQLRLGSPEAAISLLTTLEPRIGELAPYLQQQALYLWGAALEAQGDWSTAAARYADAAGKEGPYTGPALLGQARALERVGDKSAAEKLYRRAYDEFPELPSRQWIASAKLPQ